MEMEYLSELSLFDLFHCSLQQKRSNKESTEGKLAVILTTISDSGKRHDAHPQMCLRNLVLRLAPAWGLRRLR